MSQIRLPLILTLERMVADTEEMINWVRIDLGKEKIFVIGHS